ncbi:MAG: hypothetical protein FWB83_01940 [Treponema sp.]|nr:hypothetical protein [Treponema sp.]
MAGKPISCITFLIITIFFTLIGLASTASTPESGDNSTDSTIEQQSAQIFWIGDGGGGKSIAILPLRAVGLAESQQYLPEIARGEFVSNFETYSAIRVLDRVTLESQYNELLSGYYSDNAEAGMDLGHLIPTDYLMIGNITRTATGYALQIQITSNADKITAASFSETVTIAELDNLIGIRRASLELLQKLGVQSTGRTRTELTQAATENRVEAQTDLARAITARRNGTIVEALTYFYQAESFDSSLLEAARNASIISTVINSGNIGENVRNDIQRRNEWLNILNEADAFFENRLFEIVYDPNLIQGAIDYNAETVRLSFSMLVMPISASIRTLTDIRNGLIQTGKMREWGLSLWPFGYSHNSSGNILSTRMFDRIYYSYGGKNFNIRAFLINEDGKVIGRINSTVTIVVGFPRDHPLFINPTNRINPFVHDGGSGSGYFVTDRFVTYNHTGEWRRYDFDGVNVNDITDTLTIEITSVNGVNVQDPANRGFINISTGSVQRRP